MTSRKRTSITTPRTRTKHHISHIAWADIHGRDDEPGISILLHTGDSPHVLHTNPDAGIEILTTNERRTFTLAEADLILHREGYRRAGQWTGHGGNYVAVVHPAS